MLPLSTEYLIKNIKSLSYSYDPEKDCWIAEHFRGNHMKSFGTIIKVKLSKKGKIKASVKCLEAPPKCHNRALYAVSDKAKIKFEDEGFKNKLKSLKID